MSEVLINACLHYGTMGAVEAGVVSVTFPVGAQPVQEGTPNAHWVTRVIWNHWNLRKINMPSTLLTEDLRLLKQQRTWVAEVFILWLSTNGSGPHKRCAEFLRFSAIDEYSPSWIFHLSIQRMSHGYKKSTIVLVSWKCLAVIQH